jgi:hypothetical protein
MLFAQVVACLVMRILVVEDELKLARQIASARTRSLDELQKKEPRAEINPRLH